MSIVAAVRRANQPGLPENSIRLRLACLGAVLVAIAACASLQEIGWTTAVGAMVLVSAGTAFSHATRARPPGWVKVMVAVGAIAACVWFFRSVSSPAGGITSVVNPLTVLLVAVLVVHSFHVPSRRDLLFTLGASAGLMAVGGAVAIDLRFGLFVVAWGCCSLWGLLEMWTSASGGGRSSATGLVLALVATSTAAAAVFLVLPAPVVSSRVSFIDRAGAGGSVGVPGGLAGDSGVAAQLSRAGSPASRDSRRRLSRLRRQPEHGAAGEPGEHPGDAGPGAASLVLGGGDLRHLAGPELDGVAAGAALPLA